MMKFFKCAKSEKIVEVIHEDQGQLICCGEPMQELVPNTTEAATEKHIPVVEQNGDTLTVRAGSTLHPMSPEHYIHWVAISTDKHTMRQNFTPDDQPEAVFHLNGETLTAVYAYCNLHGLWRAEL